MQGIVIRYRYDGDEAIWQAVVNSFIDAIGGDAEVRGGFHYTVTTAKDGIARTHMGRWDSDETLATMQSRDYFKVFSKAIQELAGGTLENQRMEIAASTD